MSAAFTISVCNTKGGVGKTTTAIALSHLIGSTGDKVTLLDLDKQGDSTARAAEFAEEGLRFAAHVEQVDGSVQSEWLAERVDEASQGCDWLIIDTGPGDLHRIGASVAAVRRNGGVCLIPTSPAPMDLTRALVTVEEQINGRAPVFVLLVMTKANTVNLRQAREDLEEESKTSGFSLLVAEVPEREAAKETLALETLQQIYESAAVEILERSTEVRK